MTNLFKIDIIYPITADLTEGEELSEVERMTMQLETGYEVDSGYWDLEADAIAQINPRRFLLKTNKDKEKRQYKKYFSEVVFLSGNVSYAVGKPESIIQKVQDFLSNKS